MSTKREPTFSSSPKFDESQLDKTLLQPWRDVIKQGGLVGLALSIFNVVVLVILSIFGYGGILLFVDFLVIFEITSLWFWSGFVIWFGPSPTYALIKTKIFGRRVEPSTTLEALQSGTKSFVSGIVLLIFLGIFVISLNL